MKVQIVFVLLLVSFAFTLKVQKKESRSKFQEKAKLASQSNIQERNGGYNQMIQKAVAYNTKVKDQNMEIFLQKKNQNQKVEESLEQHNLKNKAQLSNEAQKTLLLQKEQKPLSLVQTKLKKSSKKCDCHAKNTNLLQNKVECPCESHAKVNCPCQHSAKVDCPCQNAAKVNCPCQHSAKVDCPCRENKIEAQLLEVENQAKIENEESGRNYNVFLNQGKQLSYLQF